MPDDFAQQRDKVFREKTKMAVTLAMQGYWDEAIVANESLLADFPESEDILNRLGRAFSELGRFGEARKTFQRALDIAPLNAIAHKNLAKLEALEGQEQPVVRRQNLRGSRFISESGRTAFLRLQTLPAKQVFATLAAGDGVALAVENGSICVRKPGGEFIGQLEPLIGARLGRLIQGGNRYSAVLTSVSRQEIILLVSESYRDPNQSNTTSFPSRQSSSQREIPRMSSFPETPSSYDVQEEEALPLFVDLDEEGGLLAEDRIIWPGQGFANPEMISEELTQDPNFF